jgi:tetratricopeptide (TPR) repeat protein
MTVCLLAFLLAVPTLAPGQKTKPSPAPEDLLAKAKEKEAAGDLDGAIDLLQKAGNTAALHLGQILEKKHDLDRAIDAYQKGASNLTGPGQGEALARLSLLQELRGIPEFQASAVAATAADPEGAWPEVALAEARAREGKGDEALALAGRAASAGAAAQVALARAQEVRGDLPAAEAAARRALEAEPDNLFANVELGRALRLEGRPAEALPILQKVIDWAPGAVGAYLEAARSKLALGRAVDAGADAQTAAALAESDPEAQALVKEVGVEAALVHLKANEIDIANQDLVALLSKEPNYAPAHVGLARVLMAKRQLDPAGAELETALKLDARLAEAHFQKGYLTQVFRQNPQAALSSYEQALALKPLDSSYRTQFGSALLEAKQFGRAIEELTHVTSTPGYERPEGFVYLGAAELGAKHYKDGIPALEKATRLAPKNSQAEAYLAWCYFGLKDAEKFKVHGQRARTLGHSEPNLLAYLERVEKGEAIK